MWFGMANLKNGYTWFPAPGMTFTWIRLTPSNSRSVKSILNAVVVIGVVLFAIFTVITQAIAGALGGTGNYSKLLYARSAAVAPLSIIYGVLGIIPVVSCLVFPLLIYGVWLDVIAVKATNQFSWGKAVMSSIGIWILLFILVAVLIIVVLALLGPSIGTVFSNIVRTL